MNRSGTPLEERFWRLVEKRGPDECWEWKGARGGGYGQIWADGGKVHLVAHRVAAVLAGLDVAYEQDGRHVHHMCKNKNCVNPRHLAVMSPEEHVRLHLHVWSEEEIVRCIRQFRDTYGVLPAATDWNVAQARKNGHALRVQRWEENDWPSLFTVQKAFGSWSAAIEAAGFPRPTLGRRKRHQELHAV